MNLFWLKSDIELSEDEISNILNSKSDEIGKRLADIEELARSEIGPIKKLTPILNGGTFCLLFEAITAKNEGFIIKTSLLPVPYFTHDFLLEKKISHLLRESHIPNVAIQLIDCSRRKYHFDYMIMEKIEGFPLSFYINSHQEEEKCLHQLGVRLALIHSIKTEGFGIAGLKKTWSDHLYTALDQHLNYCCSNKIMDLDHAQMIGKIFSRYEKKFSITQSKLLHGDLSNQNIFVRKNPDEILLIDWGDSLNGDPIFDIAMWGTFIGNHEKRHALLEGYQTVSKLPIDFEVLYWLYYLRIILSKTVHRQRFGYYKTDKISPLSRIRLPLEELAKCESC